MVDVWLPYGRTDVCVRIPARNFLGSINPKELPAAADATAEIERAIANPIGSKRLTEMSKPDEAYPLLVRHLIPDGLRGFIFAALAGAVISTLASVLNSASTIFTMDIYKRYLHRSADEPNLVRVGRISTIVFMAVACGVSLSPILKGGVFKFIQEFQGYISPGIVAAFVFGFVVKPAPPAAGIAALVLSAPIYGLLQWQFAAVPYLHRMLWTLGILVGVMAAITFLKPLVHPKPLPVRREMDVRTEPAVYVWGSLVIAIVILGFVIFH